MKTLNSIFFFFILITLFSSCFDDTQENPIVDQEVIPLKETHQLGTIEVKSTMNFSMGYIQLKEIVSHNFLMEPKVCNIASVDYVGQRLSIVAPDFESQDTFTIEYVSASNKRDTTQYFISFTDNYFYITMDLDGKTWESYGEAYRRPAVSGERCKIQGGYFIPHEIIHFFPDNLDSIELHKTYKIDKTTQQNALLLEVSVDDYYTFDGEYQIEENSGRVIKGTFSGVSLPDKNGKIVTIKNGKFRAIKRY